MIQAVLRPRLLSMTTVASFLAAALVLPTSPALAQKKEASTTKATAAAPATAAETVLKVEPSKIAWVGKKRMGSSHNGHVPVKSGQLTVAGDTIKSGLIEVDMTGMTNEDLKGDADKQGKLLGHLKSDDFFSVAKHPTATLNIKNVMLNKKTPKEGSHLVSGELTIKGKPAPIEFPANIEVTAQGAKASGKLKFDRSLYDVRYGSSKFEKLTVDKIIEDFIELDFNLQAKK